MKKSGFVILSIFAGMLVFLLVHTSHSQSSKSYTSLAVEPSTGRAFALSEDEDDGVDVFDVKTAAVIKTILFDEEIKAIAVNEEKKILAAAGERNLYIVSAETLETIKNIPISEEPLDLAIDSVSGAALITNEHNKISVININTGEPVTEINVAKKPVSIAIDPNLRIAVIIHETEGESDNVTIIDLATFTISKTLPAGKNPCHVAINPTTHQAAVANEKSNDLTIIDLNTKNVTGTISLPKHPKASSYNTCLNTLAVIGGEDRPWLQVLDAGTWGTKTSYTFERKLNDVTVHPSLNKAAIAGESGLIIQDLPNPTPELTSLTPDHALRGGAALSLTLAGKGFLSSTGIYLNGNKTDAVFQACGSINITIPDTYLQKAGKVEIKAVNPTPEGGESNLLYLNANNPVPAVTLLQPSQASAGETGISLSIIGAGFFDDTSIYVNGFPRAFTLLGQNLVQTALTAADLENGGYLDITASNPQPGGGVSALARFTVLNPAPTLTSIDPTAIPANSADTTIVLTGDNFVRSSQVVFNNQTYTALFINKTRIEATIPAQALTNTGTYPIKVVNPAPGGGETSSLAVTISQRNPNVEPLPEGSFGKQYEDLIPADATVGSYTPKRFAIVTGLVQDRNLQTRSGGGGATGFAAGVK